MSEVNGAPAAESAKCLAKVIIDVLQDNVGKKAFPNVHDLLSQRWKAGKMTRQGSRVSIKADGGVLRVTIECPTEGLVSTMAVDSLVGLLEAVEGMIVSGKLSWGLTWSKAKKNLPTLDGPVQ